MTAAMWHLLRVVVRAGRAGRHAGLCAAVYYFERDDELILNSQCAVEENSIFIFTDYLNIII